MRSILAYFNGLREKHARDKVLESRFQAARQAIPEGGSALETLLDAPFKPNQRRVLLATAINTDNTGIFQTVLDALVQGDPNYKLREYSDSLDISLDLRVCSLLYQAIASEKPRVALWLAANPKTDIRSSGYSESSVYYGGGFTRSGHIETRVCNFPSCLEEARALGLSDVAAVLAQREATLLRSQAAALQDEAEHLLKPS